MIIAKRLHLIDHFDFHIYYSHIRVLNHVHFKSCLEQQPTKRNVAMIANVHINKHSG